jgi:hypothetical protein
MMERSLYELHTSRSSSNIIPYLEDKIKGDETGTGDMQQQFLSEKLKGRNRLGDRDINGRFVLKIYLQKQGVRFGLDSTGLGQGPVAVVVNMVTNFQDSYHIGRGIP